MHDDATGEKHIADVRTPDGVVMEFQHSHLRADERGAREHFYRNMVWVVDGTRLQRDLPRFIRGARDLRPIGKDVFRHAFPDELLPKNWLGCAAPAFFDFGAPEDPEAARFIQNCLWCLLPQNGHQAIVVKIERDAFIRIAQQNAQSLLFMPLRAQAEQRLAAERARDRREHLRAIAAMMERQRQWRPRHHWQTRRPRRRTF